MKASEAKIPSLRGLSEAFQHLFLPISEGLGLKEVRNTLLSEDTLFEEALAGSLARFCSFSENKLPRAQEPKLRWDFELRFLRKGYRAQLFGTETIPSQKPPLIYLSQISPFTLPFTEVSGFIRSDPFDQ